MLQRDIVICEASLEVAIRRSASDGGIASSGQFEEMAHSDALPFARDGAWVMATTLSREGRETEVLR